MTWFDSMLKTIAVLLVMAGFFFLVVIYAKVSGAAMSNGGVETSGAAHEHDRYRRELPGADDA